MHIFTTAMAKLGNIEIGTLLLLGNKSELIPRDTTTTKYSMLFGFSKSENVFFLNYEQNLQLMLSDSKSGFSCLRNEERIGLSDR